MPRDSGLLTGLFVRRDTVGRGAQGMGYFTGGSFSVDLANAVAQGNHIAAGRFSGWTTRVPGKFRIIHFQQ